MNPRRALLAVLVILLVLVLLSIGHVHSIMADKFKQSETGRTQLSTQSTRHRDTVSALQTMTTILQEHVAASKENDRSLHRNELADVLHNLPQEWRREQQAVRSELAHLASLTKELSRHQLPPRILVVFVFSHFQDPRAVSNLELLLRHLDTASGTTRVRMLITVPGAQRSKLQKYDGYAGHDVRIQWEAPNEHLAAFESVVGAPSIDTYRAV